MKSNSSVAAVAEAVKRYKYVVLGVQFVNNSMNARQVITILDSLSHHFNSVQNLNLSENNVGIVGASHLAELFFKMKELKILQLSGCNLTDRGVTILLKAMEESNLTIEELDLSAN